MRYEKKKILKPHKHANNSKYILYTELINILDAQYPEWFPFYFLLTNDITTVTPCYLLTQSEMLKINIYLCTQLITYFAESD